MKQKEEKKKTHYIMKYRIIQNVNICLIGITEQYRHERTKERFEKDWLRISINIESILNPNFMLREFQTVKIKTKQTEESKRNPYIGIAYSN